jgi:hypothetical protein
MNDERRSAPRRRTLLTATMRFECGTKSHDCQVRNLSDGGARLEFPMPSMLPQAFDLDVPYLDQRFRAEIAWRSDQALGVRLQKNMGGSGETLSQAERIRALELEREKLRVRVRQLSDET